MVDLSAAASLLLAARAKTSADERAAFLDQACRGDAELRRYIEDQLAARSETDSSLQPPTTDQSATVDHVPAAAEPGDRIGPYKLLQCIGEGGMGVVWLAEQEAPVRRQVALKLIKPGMDSSHVVARFEAERQALAVMDHPNIARVFDAGMTAAGRPYFVMELVHGVPITRFCDDRRLTVRERLRLFVPVCQAVQHAHQKGLIHRDIKPSNILVAVYDDKPVPKIIDFGVAKAMQQPLTERTMFTQIGVLVGTFEYMSPEQAEMSALGVDTRTDVYSLGAVLYELLTGSLPLGHKRLRNAPLDEVIRLIREEEPPRPSTRLSSSDNLTKSAALRGTEPARLPKLVKGELDWIVMKCLEKDRSRRYETANGLARDLERYLEDEPVEACPPSTRYRLKKFLHKHRAGVLTAAAFTGLLLAGAALSTWEAVRASHAEKLSQARLGQFEKANDVLTGILNDLDPREFTNKEAGLRQILGQRLEKAAGQLDSMVGEDPVTVVRLQTLLGHTLTEIGRYKAGTQVLRKALANAEASLGPEDSATITTADVLAEAYAMAAAPKQAMPLFERVLAWRQDHLGASDRDTLDTKANLSLLYRDLGRLDKAVPLTEQVIAGYKARPAEDHQFLLVAMHNLGNMYTRMGRPEKAIDLFQEVLAERRKTIGPDHLATLNTMAALGMAYLAAGRLDKALPLLQTAEAKERAKVGPDHPFTLSTLCALAEAEQDSGNHAKARSDLEEALTRSRKRLGPEHGATVHALAKLAWCCQQAGDNAEAERMWREAADIWKSKSGAQSLPYAGALAHQGECLVARHKPAEAEPLLREALAIQVAEAPDQWQTFSTRSLLGVALVDQKKYSEAEPLLLQADEGLRRNASRIPVLSRAATLAGPATALVRLYEGTRSASNAEAWRLRLADIRGGDARKQR